MPHDKLDRILETVRAADRLDATSQQMIEALRSVRQRLTEIEAIQHRCELLLCEEAERSRRIEALLLGRAVERTTREN